MALLVTGCSKTLINGNTEREQLSATGNAVDESSENCRLSNQSDCRPIEMKRGEQENIEVTGAPDENSNESAKKINLSEETELSNCEEGWKCVQAKYRAYQFSNCSWSSIEFCVYGCKDNICVPSLKCKPNSFKCSNDVVMKCSEDGSGWLNNQSCDYQCANGICVSKNETIETNATNLTDISNLTNAANQTQNLTLTEPIQNSTNQNKDYIADKCINVILNLSDEYFTLKNACQYPIGITSWTVQDNSTHIFTFSNFNLNINAGVTVHTGSGSNTSTELYWGKGSSIWNNDGDMLYLRNEKNELILSCTYTSKSTIGICQ